MDITTIFQRNVKSPKHESRGAHLGQTLTTTARLHIDHTPITKGDPYLCGQIFITKVSLRTYVSHHLWHLYEKGRGAMI